LGKQVIFADGAMGTQLQEAGLAPGEAPTLFNLTHPHVVRNVHCAYLNAGATLLTTNTFSAGPLMLTGKGAEALSAITLGVQLAHEARQLCASEAFIALNIGPLGQLLKPLGSLDFDAAVEIFTRQIEVGVARGVDLILIETMIDTYELKAAVLAAQEVCDLPVVATVALSEQGRMLNGADCACVCALLEGLGVDALGINCGAGPREVAPYIEEMRARTSLPLVLSPNAGLPLVVEGKTTYPASVAEFAEAMLPLVVQYTAIAGGCCGTTPAHIEALQESCEGMVARAVSPIARHVISSYATALDLDNSPESTQLRIDKRVDPACDSTLATTLAQGSYDYAVDLILDALDADAQIIGICAHQAGIDERIALPALIEAAQSMVKVPFLIISASLEALERALRVYNGCALVDLSRFAPDQRETATALAARYGAVLDTDIDTDR
jgi:5-methyltetrahydrofolate--homocysteine methyltransferase